MTLKIIGGSNHREFTKKICDHLGIKETKTTSFTFSNRNRFVTIDEPVRGDDVFVIQTQTQNADAELMELFILIRTLHDASAERITAVMPYLPYSRSDKKDQPRVCITARLIADLLQTAGANRALIMEMHSLQIQGFFSIPCDHLIAAPDIIQYLKNNWNLENYVLVAGDAGATKMINKYADGLNLPIAMIDKRRIGNDEKVVIKSVIGEVANKKVLIIDDETLSGGTLIEDAKFLLEKANAVSVEACFVHANLGLGAALKLNSSLIKRFVTTDTIPSQMHNLKNLEIVSVSARFAEIIKRIHENQSVHSLNSAY